MASYRIGDVHPLCSLRLHELAIDEQLDGGLHATTIFETCYL